MKRFLITSSRFAGQAEIFYNEKGLLNKIDLTGASLDAPTTKAFKAAVPSTLEILMQGNSFENATVVAADVEVTFEMFWNAYAKKINRLRCESLWKKLSKIEQVNAFVGIAAYDRFLIKEQWRSKADPETYLRNKYWQNEYK